MKMALAASLGISALLAPAEAHAGVLRALEPGRAEDPAWGRPAFEMQTVPPPVATAAPIPAYTGTGGCSSGFVHDLIVSQPWDVSYALYVADRESNCLPSAYNATPWPTGSSCHASGVFQILTGGPECDNWSRWSESCGWGGASVFDAVANVETAACIVARGGWGPWAL